MDKRLQLIFSRRSIRVYTGEPIDEADLTSLLEAGMAAPSASNRKPWHFCVFTDVAKFKVLAKQPQVTTTRSDLSFDKESLCRSESEEESAISSSYSSSLEGERALADSEESKAAGDAFMTVEQEGESSEIDVEMLTAGLEPMLFELNPLATEGTENDDQRMSELQSKNSD